MKISELTEHSQRKLREELKRQSDSWEHSRIWWAKGESDGARQMIAWNAAFNKFSAEVLGDEPIDSAFMDWSGQEITHCDYDKINVPQLSIHDIYRAAIRDIEQASEVQP